MRALTRRRWQAWIVNLISRVANYQGPGGTPSVTEALMREGDVGVTLSVLYAPFDEMDLERPYGAPPRASYFEDILAQLDLVERHVAGRPGDVAIARSPAELDRLLASGGRVLIHCIEGGFQLGRDESEIHAHVRTLAERGVAYVTLAHLFWRDVATNAPALPFLPDWLYHLAFPQPNQGLSRLGFAALEAMVAHGVLVDISHMSPAAVDDTLSFLEGHETAREVPVLATHTACRFGGLEYSFGDDAIRRVSDLGGVLGLIFCEHFITSGLQTRARDYGQSVGVLCRHIDHIHQLTGCFDHIAIGSDLDGYIKPALPGLEHMGHMRALQASLSERYGREAADKICHDNALRALRSGWRGAISMTDG